MDFIFPSHKVQFFSGRGSLIAVKSIQASCGLKVLVQEWIMQRDMLGRGCFGPLYSLSLLVWFWHKSTSKSYNQKKKRGRLGLAVRSPSWLEKQIYPEFVTAFPGSLSWTYSCLCVFASWSKCWAGQTDRQTLTYHWKYKVIMSLERWFSSLPQGLCNFSSTESCSCVTSLLLISSFPSLHLITLVVSEAAFGANSHTCCQKESHVPAA